MRKVFIDCGYFAGKCTKMFKAMEEFTGDYELYAFEASEISERLFKIAEGDGVKLINKAVWIYDGDIEFFSSSRRSGQANSVFKNPKNPKSEKIKKTKCIDFSKWIKENFSREDFIVLKMDIEGAEYQVLQKMLKDKTLDYINVAFIEYHYDRIKGVCGEDFISLRNKMSEETSVDYRTAMEWAIKKKNL